MSAPLYLFAALGYCAYGWARLPGRAPLAVAAVAALCHLAALLLQWGARGGADSVSLAVTEAASFFALAAFVAAIVARVDAQTARWAAAAAAVAALLPLLPPAVAPPRIALNFSAGAHLALAVFAHAAAILAFLQFCVLRRRESQLRASVADFSAQPLLQGEAACFRLLAWALGFSAAAIASGIWFAAAAGQPPLVFNHKTLFAFFAVILWSALLAGRHFWGWRGAAAARWLGAGFAALLLSYLGTAVVLQVVLQRGG